LVIQASETNWIAQADGRIDAYAAMMRLVKLVDSLR
jgi:hypothetical protein